ncbi:MAG: leucine--tRNA ligase [Candidatus Diapherotrites archaeon]|nr:leucine--tRNA ligase [Candidatus Diapherotrites archaeon]
MPAYKHEKVELKWQKEWENAGLSQADADPEREKYFLIFAYPGISGFLHVGHMRGYSYSDIITRYKRMRGFNVLFPAGFHATGIHAVAIAEKIKRGDKKLIQYFKDNGVSDKQIEKFKDYNEVVKFFSKVYVDEYWKRFGFLIDWRRLTSTLHPGYHKFIQWQFRKLMQQGLLVQKEYYGAFCPHCGPVAVDATETDLQRGGNAEKLEFTLLKFKYGDSYLVAATLRPETIYGQTNMWVRPDINYVKVEVDGEKWIVSEECSKALTEQGKKVKVLEEVPGKSMIGKYCHAPGIDGDIIILPSDFPDPKIGTGLVTSVPSDAPYDYIALKDLQGNPGECRKYGIDPEKVKAIKLIPIIKSKGYGEFPAEEIVERMGIKSQRETEKLEEATKEIYKLGYHTGVMRENCGPYAGMRVEEAKDAMKEDLIKKGLADVFYAFSEPVVCRCGRDVVIRKITDQWFIKYSDESLTEKSKLHAEGMNIFPEDYKREIPAVLDWFQDRPCVRQGSWLGTKFPFDEKWIIEPISDSTLYPAYYVVSIYENNGVIKPEEMTEEFFDYVFLGKGEPKKPIWKRIREDFEYWYPLDVNLGGKEHKTVHFPAFLMNHVAILPGTYWPRGIFVNWWVLGKAGSKISKSKGGAEAIPDILETYSADSIRLYYSHVASPFQDIYWDADTAFKYKNALERAYVICETLSGLKGGKSRIDSWLEYNFNESLREATDAMENYDLRVASDVIFYAIPRILNWYQRRGGENTKMLSWVLRDWVRLMTPFTPHLAEEIWHSVLGEKNLVSVESWPKAREVEADERVNEEEELLRDILSDTRDIFKLVGGKPSKVFIYTPAKWKWQVIGKVRGKERDFKACIQAVAADQELKKDGPRFIKAIFKKLPGYSSKPQIDEYDGLKSAELFLSEELGVPVKVFREEDPKKYDPTGKASKALPLYPAIYVE